MKDNRSKKQQGKATIKENQETHICPHPLAQLVLQPHPTFAPTASLHADAASLGCVMRRISMSRFILRARKSGAYVRPGGRGREVSPCPASARCVPPVKQNLHPPLQRHPLPLQKLELIARGAEEVVDDGKEAKADVGPRGAGAAVFSPFFMRSAGRTTSIRDWLV
ncbi:hypothetical protein GALMADRAFT_149149 [Galerina marginata CBS 339.88]|uniref:Uncharacterized protein n=1 Tax=Galerina marginata (strain CBS 339.88) TaxID=685588 RepID=A0A067SB28_GALM3|nr:hypothetical protein GALMADRAFT_149149 [Galerina marginata CBS 339.88]